MSGIIDSTAFVQTAVPETSNNSTWQAFVTAIYEVGCLIGAIFTLAYGDRVGRRRNIIMGGMVMILGVIIQITCVIQHGSTTQFIVGRIVTGVGNGMNTSVIPMYQVCSSLRETNNVY